MTNKTTTTDLFGLSQEDLAQKSRRAASARRAGDSAGGRPVAATPTESASMLAARLPGDIRLGTSSWSFPGWAGLVYGSRYTQSRLAKDGLAAYAAHPLLRTVSIDRTFYAPLAEHEFAKYAEQVPTDFRFVVKAPMAITSSYVRSETGEFSESPYFLNVEYAIEEFIAPCSAGLGATTGPLVFQFPPQGRRITANPDPFINQLYRFLNQLPPGLPYAVEVRDRELLTSRFFKCLTTTATHFCVASHAKMPSPAAQIQLMTAQMPPGDFICRWSLHAGFQYTDAKARYSPFNRLVDEDMGSRSALAIAVASAARAGYASFVTINNKAEGCAPLSVEKLAEAIADILTPPAAEVAAEQ
ncbi:MAG: DUF72 domain-containing protein [Rhodocyclaceae bacterium]|jgi:uncharacterized protein YecE (DUF72 family)|nr:DUF72 domain-containing protein [Rhodocyclaceae bacterium]MCA3033859.1 DUF72 domain-containing protein [Rhodocyclaceae bacterium]MCA3084150.1 DUF72 domain-containing protein [Rhodocyclaceae bacterium]MCA3087079.1 DUF72 domain-containing protein [Rhodocyclaceae bacterium]MCE2724830.1 DUF72 domain-containing protein [Betaproteobacteria bacterium]